MTESKGLPKTDSLVTKADQGTGDQMHTPGKKADNGKPDASLLLDFGKALCAVAAVGTFGKMKYCRGGWLHVESGQERYTAAMLRHQLAESYEEHDQESGLLHAAHAAWDAIARLELMLRDGKQLKKEERHE